MGGHGMLYPPYLQEWRGHVPHAPHQTAPILTPHESYSSTDLQLLFPTEIALECRRLRETILVTKSSSKLNLCNDRSSNMVSENATESKLSIQQAQLIRTNKRHYR